MKNHILPCFCFLFCSSVLAELPGGPAWRRVAIYPDIAATAKVYHAELNLGRNDWRQMMPLKVELGGVTNGVFAFRLNGKDVGVVRAAPWSQELAAGFFAARDYNQLEIEIRAAPSAPVSTVTLFCTMPAAKGPLLGVREFFTNEVDTSLPALSEIPSKVAANDLAGATKIFADYVRATLKPEKIVGDWMGRKLSHGDLASLKRSAEDIMNHRLSTLGRRYQYPRARVEWEFNPIPNGYCEWNYHLSYLDCGTTLAEYYLATGDERAAQSWHELLQSWFEDEPAPPLGAGAGSTKTWRSLECGNRQGHFARQIHAFLHSPACTDDFIVMFFRSICEHGRRLRHDHARQGNWLTNEMNGLVRIGLLYPFLKQSSAWYAYGIDRLTRELSAQVYPDGFQCELATGYHGSVISHFLSAIRTHLDVGREPPAALLAGVERMFDIYPRLTRPDRRLPGVNDASCPAIAPILRKAVPLYPMRTDFRWFVSDGQAGKPPAYLSTALPYSGAVALRTSWAKDGLWAYMDGSPYGMQHQHEDKLNVLLSAYGKNMIVEAGTFDYDTSDMRKYVLSTRAHNTIRIDGMDQNRGKGYRWHPEDILKKADVELQTAAACDFARSVYDGGYGENKMRVRHERRLYLQKGVPGLQPFFVVVDRLTARDEKPHAYEQIWHLETSDLTCAPNSFTADFGASIGLAAAFSDTDATVVDMKGTKKPLLQGWMPVMGGAKEHRPVPTPVLKGSFTGRRRIVAVFYPFAKGANLLKGVTASADIGAREYVLHLADGTSRTLTEP